MDIGNYLPRMDSDKWLMWFPSNGISPIMEKVVLDGEPALLTAAVRFEQYGKWACDVPDIVGGAAYSFRVEYQARNVDHEAVSVYGMLSWFDKAGKIHTRDYLRILPEAGDGWKAMGRTVEAPEAAASLTVELGFRWTDGGSVIWRRPVLSQAEPIWHRVVKVASAFISKAGSLEGNLEMLLRAIDNAGAAGADIVCLGEIAYDLGVDLPLDKRAVEIPGPVTERLSERARRNNLYVVLSMNENDGGLFHNTGVLIDRQGKIAGKYRKAQLPLNEAEEGITPGRGVPVFDTDFGRIGVMICWDSIFPEVARTLARQGAEIIFVPTLMNTDVHAPARAMENGVFVVVSEERRGKIPCKIYNPYGELVAAAMGNEYNESGLCTATIDLDKRYYTYYLSVGPAFGEGKSCYLQERRNDIFPEACGLAEEGR